MIVHEAGRGSGKTHKIVQLLKHNPRSVMIVFSQAEADRIVRHYDPQGHWRLAERVIPCERREKLYGIDTDEVHVDNLDCVLAQLFRFPIGECWWTPQDAAR